MYVYNVYRNNMIISESNEKYINTYIGTFFQFNKKIKLSLCGVLYLCRVLSLWSLQTNQLWSSFTRGNPPVYHMFPA